MKVVALDTHDGYREGDVYDVPEHRAEKLIRKGLVKAGPIPQNKMAAPLDNKANPTRAVGAEPIASSLPAAPALPNPIAPPSAIGASREAWKQIQPVASVPFANPVKRPRGRPRKNPDAS